MLVHFLTQCPFRVRQSIEFHYPERNLIHVPPRLVRRRFTILRVLDCHETPISDYWLRRNSGVRRGRFLVRGFDFDKKQWRQFYLDSMWRPQVFNEPLYRFAYLDSVSPIDDKRRYFGAPFTEAERRSPLFIDMLTRWNQDLATSPDPRIIGVVPWNQ